MNLFNNSAYKINSAYELALKWSGNIHDSTLKCKSIFWDSLDKHTSKMIALCLPLTQINEGRSR